MNLVRIIIRIAVITIICCFITGCCNEIDSGPQKIDVEPLRQIQLNLTNSKDIQDIIDLKMFDKVSGKGSLITGFLHADEKSGFESSSSDFEVTLDLKQNNLIARDVFKTFCENPLFTEKKDITFGGIEDNQYCISYIRGLRYSIDQLCSPTGDYISFVVYQKGQLVIEIIEYSRGSTTVNKNLIINLLAQNIKK